MPNGSRYNIAIGTVASLFNLPLYAFHYNLLITVEKQVATRYILNATPCTSLVGPLDDVCIMVKGHHIIYFVDVYVHHERSFTGSTLAGGNG